MKKKTTKRSAKTTHWSEVSEVNFELFRVKRNRFAKSVKKEGILLVHDAPSRASLRAIPEADFATAKVKRNPYAERMRTTGLTLQVGQGRPRGGLETGPTVVKSVRLPPAVWSELEKRARAEGVAVHALVRKAVLALLIAF
ncbi:MAG: hypothetical protein ABI627_06825 [Polyangiaceae bacterium]